MSRLKKLADLSNVEQFQSQVYFDHQGSKGTRDHKIAAIYNGKEVGYIEFSEQPNNTLSLEDCIVNEKFKDHDLEEMLMDEFGKEFEANYISWKIALNFHDPAFELAFRNLIAGGLIPANALDENMVNRDYDNNQKQIWQDLRNKIPEQYRGARRKDIRRKYS